MQNVIKLPVINQELVTEIKREVESVIEEMDDSFDDCYLDQYADVLLDPDNSDRDQIFKNFADEFSPSGVGFVPGDSLDRVDLIDALKEKLGEKELIRVIAEYSEAEPTDSYYRQSNSVDSVLVGEMEYQIDVEYHPDLAALIAQATDADLKEARVKRDHFFVYGRPCESVFMRLDADAFLADKRVKKVAKALDALERKEAKTKQKISSRR